MKPVWTRLIRFIAPDGRIHYGEPILPTPDYDIGDASPHHELRARILEGADIFDISGATHVTDEEVLVEKVLGPLAQGDVPILRCVGLNYAGHGT